MCEGKQVYLIVRSLSAAHSLEENRSSTVEVHGVKSGDDASRSMLSRSDCSRSYGGSAS